MLYTLQQIFRHCFLQQLLQTLFSGLSFTIFFFYIYFVSTKLLFVSSTNSVCEIDGEVGGSLNNRERLNYFFPLLWKIPFYALTYA